MRQPNVTPPVVGYPVDGFPGHLIRVAVLEVREKSIGPTYTHVSVNEAGKLPWFQRLMLKWLDKLGAVKRPWRDTKAELVTIERRSEPLLGAMIEAFNDIQDRYNHTPTVCYIGERALRDIMKLTHNMSQGGLDEMYWHEAIHLPHGRIVNMRVNVVPWVDGMFFV